MSFPERCLLHTRLFLHWIFLNFCWLYMDESVGFSQGWWWTGIWEHASNLSKQSQNRVSATGLANIAEWAKSRNLKGPHKIVAGWRNRIICPPLPKIDQHPLLANTTKPEFPFNKTPGCKFPICLSLPTPKSSHSNRTAVPMVFPASVPAVEFRSQATDRYLSASKAAMAPEPAEVIASQRM